MNVHLDRWQAAGLIDAETAGRIREWESRQEPRSRTWLIWLTLAFGAVLLAAGLYLFISAHWENLPPAARFTIVVAVLLSFHAVAALTKDRFPALSIAMHAAGTMALGGAIALTGQIYHTSEHWPGGILLWAIGAVASWALLRQWPQAVLAAMLVPAWIASEWFVFRFFVASQSGAAVAGLTGLSLAYLAARTSDQDGAERKAVAWLGAIALLPLTAFCCLERWRYPDSTEQWFGWVLSVVLPFAVAAWLGSIRQLGVYALLAIWPFVLCMIAREAELAAILWFAVGGGAMAWWGVATQRMERINLGVAAFAIAVIWFYFSSLFDKLGRSASLVTLGLLFLGGGWALERTRRRLIATAREHQPVEGGLA